MSSRRCRRVIAAPSTAFKGFRFPPEIIVLAVRWYLRYGLSYRDLEELLVERGIEVDHVTVSGGCSASRPFLRMRRGRVVTRSVIVGSWMRRT
jgi:transposase, IS6 family